jgi:hypothetical protein
MHLYLDFHELQEPEELLDLWLGPEPNYHQLIHNRRLTKLVDDLSILESNDGR